MSVCPLMHSITQLKYSISTMTARPAIADKWVSYNNGAMHFSPKRRSPIFQSFTVGLPQLTCALYPIRLMVSVTHQRSRRRPLPRRLQRRRDGWLTSRPLAASGRMH